MGLHWDTAADTLHVATPQLEDNSSATKRQVASDLARTFDILGWFAPSTVKVKAVMQRLWQLGLNWDEQVPSDIEDIWKTWRNQLPLLTRHPMPCCYFQPSKSALSIQLHGFSDASKVAYAGVVYVRAVYQDATVSVSLMLAKSRIAPLKGITVPRLELCGVQLLSKLMDIARKILSIDLCNTFAWCDSSVVLGWLNTTPGRLNTFVSNRVVDTISRLPPTLWRYVSTKHNPADVASRGLFPNELLQH